MNPLSICRVEIQALSAAFFAPGYNNDGCKSLPVPPPSAIQGIIAAATGNPDESGFQAGWRFDFHSDYEDFEKIVPSRRKPETADFESYRTGYRLGRTPVRRTYLIEPRLVLYVEERLANALLAPHHTLRLGRTQDLAWVSKVETVTLESTDAAQVKGIVVPFPPPPGALASFLWNVPAKASGYGQREWSQPRPHAFLTAKQSVRDLSGRNFFFDPQIELAVPFYDL